jgi:hypothetical protein
MDVASSSKGPADFPPASSSTDKRAKIRLPDEHLTTLSSNMDTYRRKWQIWVDKAEAHDFQWSDILWDVLRCLSLELSATNVKSSVVNLNFVRADDIVEGLNENELEEWKVCVRKVVESNDWIDLLVRRTYISDYQIIRSHLIPTTVERNKPKMSYIAPDFGPCYEQEDGTFIPVH